MDNNGESFPMPRKKLSQQAKEDYSKAGYTIKEGKNKDTIIFDREGDLPKSTREIRSKLTIRKALRISDIGKTVRTSGAWKIKVK